MKMNQPHLSTRGPIYRNWTSGPIVNICYINITYVNNPDSCVCHHCIKFKSFPDIICRLTFEDLPLRALSPLPAVYLRCKSLFNYF